MVQLFITVLGLSCLTVGLIACEKMPPKKVKKVARTSEEEDEQLLKVDVQYNPDIVQNLLDDLEKQVNLKCAQIQRDADAMVMSLRGAFSLEIFKLPKSVQEMTVSRFKQDFGESLEQVTKGAMSQKAPIVSKPIAKQSNYKEFETPKGKVNPRMMETPSRRNPKEGEVILSANGSPLGEFQTVKKAPRNGKALVPATPSVHVPLKTGDVIDVANLDDDDIENMNQESKQDAMKQMESIMANMQAMMAKLGKA